MISIRDGKLYVPRRAVGDGLVGDGAEELTPSSDSWPSWLAWAKRSQQGTDVLAMMLDRDASAR